MKSAVGPNHLFRRAWWRAFATATVRDIVGRPINWKAGAQRRELAIHCAARRLLQSGPPRGRAAALFHVSSSAID